MRMIPGLATCEELEKFVVEYVDGSLPEKQRRIFEHHLGLCVACGKYIQDYQKVIRLGRAAFEDTEHDCEAMPESLVKAILTARTEAE